MCKMSVGSSVGSSVETSAPRSRLCGIPAPSAADCLTCFCSALGIGPRLLCVPVKIASAYPPAEGITAAMHNPRPVPSENLGVLVLSSTGGAHRSVAREGHCRRHHPARPAHSPSWTATTARSRSREASLHATRVPVIVVLSSTFRCASRRLMMACWRVAQV